MFTTNKQQLFIYSLLITATLLLVALLLPKTIHAATIEVNSTADTQANDGECTLREAIVAANTNTVSGAAANECVAGDAGADTINFNISGSEVHTISPATALPTITEQLTIDGYSQTGAEENTAVSPNPINSVIKIGIDLSGVSDQSYGLRFSADNSILKGLSIYGKDTVGGESGGVSIMADDVLVQGNYIGVLPDGQTLYARDSTTLDASILVPDSAGVSGHVIGGENASERNIIANKDDFGLELGGEGAYIYGNYIGIARDGVTDLGGHSGIVIYAANVTVGGNTAARRNVMSGGELGQLVLASGSMGVATAVTVQGNYFGTDYTGQKNASISSGAGVSISAGANDILIGGTNDDEANTFVSLKGVGVAVSQYTIQAVPITLNSFDVAILGNTISDIETFDYFGESFGNTNLGIDIFSSTLTSGFGGLPDLFQSQGPTPNDVGDGDTGPNGFINTPVLKTAQQVGNQLTITYDLDADDAEEPANEYRVEFFANDESSIFGYGPGETYLGAVTTTPGTDKTAVLTVSGDHTNKALSSTTTAVDSTTDSGFGSTSEFSKNISIGSASDFDADGIADSIENTGPNSGDANGDGTPDSQQPTVTTYQTSSGTYATLSTTGCSENGTVSSFSIANASATDNGYIYPYDLTDFTLNCSRGDTVNVELIIHDESDPTNYLPRKYNPNTSSFTTVDGATVGTTTIGSTNPLLLTYSITDGGLYDDDNEANGIIVDPIGLATELTETTQVGAPNTGLHQYWLLDIKG